MSDSLAFSAVNTPGKISKLYQINLQLSSASNKALVGIQHYDHFIVIHLPIWKRLHIVTVTMFKEYLIVTVTTFREYLIVTVTISKKYLIVTVTMFKEHLKLHFQNTF